MRSGAAEPTHVGAAHACAATTAAESTHVGAIEATHVGATAVESAHVGATATEATHVGATTAEAAHVTATHVAATAHVTATTTHVAATAHVTATTTHVSAAPAVTTATTVTAPAAAVRKRAGRAGQGQDYRERARFIENPPSHDCSLPPPGTRLTSVSAHYSTFYETIHPVIAISGPTYEHLIFGR
jgi:hypothetical protein